jgi:hypothetical protein
MRMLMLLLLLILLPSCVPAVGCETWRPITIRSDDGLTSETARQILAHNLTGERLCGWRGR